MIKRKSLKVARIKRDTLGIEEERKKEKKKKATFLNCRGKKVKINFYI